VSILCNLVAMPKPSCSERLTGAREGLQGDLDYLNRVLGNLDELGDIMGLMLSTQDSIEACFSHSFLRNTN
jgi:hypothetical protein